MRLSPSTLACLLLVWLRSSAAQGFCRVYGCRSCETGFMKMKCPEFCDRCCVFSSMGRVRTRKSQECGFIRPTTTTMPPRYLLANECGKSPAYTPCVSSYEANKAFKQCCLDLGISNCLTVCTYNIPSHQAARIFDNSSCTYENLPKLIFCASNGRDNTKCCKDLRVKSSQPSCVDFCHSRRLSENGLNPAHEACVPEIHKILRCHQAGLQLADLF